MNCSLLKSKFAEAVILQNLLPANENMHISISIDYTLVKGIDKGSKVRWYAGLSDGIVVQLSGSCVSI